jgi:phosphoenolpyruvate synthase/pyruvate phosphate dikinase
MVEKSLEALGRGAEVTGRQLIVSLLDDEATDSALVGAKASALAKAARAELPVLDGLVLTTQYSAEVESDRTAADHEATAEAFDRASALGDVLIVRSSSCGEDTAASSMAGQFESVAGVKNFDDLVRAVDTVLLSSKTSVIDAPMAVLIQPMVSTRSGGVAFGADPVTGRADRILVNASSDPVSVVDGSLGTEGFLLKRDGSLLEHSRGDGQGNVLAKAELTKIAALVRRSEQHPDGGLLEQDGPIHISNVKKVG